jgi:hypothetical protein
VDKSSAIADAHLQAAVAALRAELPTHAILQAITTATAAAAQQAAADNQQLQQRLEKLENSLAASRAENRKAVHSLRAEGAERASLSDLQSYIPRSEVHKQILLASHHVLYMNFPAHKRTLHCHCITRHLATAVTVVLAGCNTQ